MKKRLISVMMAVPMTAVSVRAAANKVSYFGTILNAKDQSIEDVGPAGRDKGKGGKYLLLPPGYEGSPRLTWKKRALSATRQTRTSMDPHSYQASFRPRLYNDPTNKEAGG
jgi:hypothetical protein